MSKRRPVPRYAPKTIADADQVIRRRAGVLSAVKTYPVLIVQNGMTPPTLCRRNKNGKLVRCKRDHVKRLVMVGVEWLTVRHPELLAPYVAKRLLGGGDFILSLSERTNLR